MRRIRLVPGSFMLMNLCTCNIRTLGAESDLLMLLEKLPFIKWDVVALSAVRRIGKKKKKKE